jgi:hypothetical protein
MNFSMIFVFLLFSFQPLQTEGEIKQLLHQKLTAFELAMKNKDLDTVLSMFESDGNYGEVKGRQEIKRVLKSYFNNEIISYAMQSEKITVALPLSNHTGKMSQEIVINGVHKKSNGVFRIIWHQVQRKLGYSIPRHCPGQFLLRPELQSNGPLTYLARTFQKGCSIFTKTYFTYEVHFPRFCHGAFVFLMYAKDGTCRTAI